MQLLHGLLVEPVGHFLDGAVGIVFDFGGRNRAALVMHECLEVHQVVILAEDIAVTLEVADARMVATVALCRFHDVVLPFPWTCWGVTHGIAQRLRTTGSGIAEVVMTIALVEPRTFLIVLHGPTGLLSPRCTEVDLRTFLLDGTHHAILGIQHEDIALGRNHVLI